MVVSFKCKTRMLFVVFVLAVYSVTVDSYKAESPEGGFSLRKLLETLDDGDVNTTYSTNATSTANTTLSTSTLSPTLAMIQVVDEQGLVIDKAFTNQNIRLKVKALTTPDFQAPFIKKCWYELYDDEPNLDDETEPIKTEIFVDKGCAEKDANLLKTDAVAFEENGALESHTKLFNLMPLFNDDFTILDIHCEATLCRADVTCYVTCSKKRSVWKMDSDRNDFELSVAFEVEKREATKPPPKAEKKPDLNDFLISGGRRPPPPGPVATEAPFLAKYQHYFTVTTLGVVVLLLLCVVGIGYMFVSYKNNKKSDDDSEYKDHVTSYHDNKMTGLQNASHATQEGVFRSKNPFASPPPAYTNASAWHAADMRPRSPYRDTCILTPSEGAVLEARQLLRNNMSAARLQDPVQRRLTLEDEGRGMYGYDNGQPRFPRAPNSAWTEFPESYREPVDIPTSPVGGEWYPVPSRRSRSPSLDRLITKSPVRGPVRGQQSKSSLIGVALREYFDKHGM